MVWGEYAGDAAEFLFSQGRLVSEEGFSRDQGLSHNSESAYGGHVGYSEPRVWAEILEPRAGILDDPVRRHGVPLELLQDIEDDVLAAYTSWRFPFEADLHHFRDFEPSLACYQGHCNKTTILVSIFDLDLHARPHLQNWADSLVTSAAPIPIARHPLAPLLHVWLSLPTISIPGWVRSRKNSVCMMV